MKTTRGLLALACALAVCGCYSTPPEPPAWLTSEQIIQLTQEGTDQAEILKKIDETRSVFYLYLKDIDALREAGVGEFVINRMLSTAWRTPVVSRHCPCCGHLHTHLGWQFGYYRW